MEQSWFAEKIKHSFKTTTYIDENSNLQLIRFTDRKESFAWVRPENILFVKSADHYVKALVSLEGEKKWMIRHSTLKGLLSLLTGTHFIRLNKFYVINRNEFSHMDEKGKMLYLTDGFSIAVSHRVAKYMTNSLR
jgi:DNA-binding LytR/AlgR family response regulator